MFKYTTYDVTLFVLLPYMRYICLIKIKKGYEKCNESVKSIQTLVQIIKDLKDL